MAEQDPPVSLRQAFQQLSHFSIPPFRVQRSSTSITRISHDTQHRLRPRNNVPLVFDERLATDTLGPRFLQWLTSYLADPTGDDDRPIDLFGPHSMARAMYDHSSTTDLGFPHNGEAGLQAAIRGAILQPINAIIQQRLPCNVSLRQRVRRITTRGTTLRDHVGEQCCDEEIIEVVEDDPGAVRVIANIELKCGVLADLQVVLSTIMMDNMVRSVNSDDIYISSTHGGASSVCNDLSLNGHILPVLTQVSGGVIARGRVIARPSRPPSSSYVTLSITCFAELTSPTLTIRYGRNSPTTQSFDS